MKFKKYGRFKPFITGPSNIVIEYAHTPGAL